MLFQKRQNDNEGVFISTVGRFFSLLKAAPVTRVTLYKNGSKVFDSVMWQGMSLHNIEFDNIYIHSDVIQDITVWAGHEPVDIQEPSLRQQTIRADQVFISNGINTLLENDPARVIARIECDKDIWVGGENMDVVLGTPQNARKYKAGQEFTIEAYGNINCFITNDAEAVLFENTELLSNVAVPWEYGAVRTRTELENAGVPYFDVEVPQRMDGVEFKVYAILEVLADNQTIQPRLYYTVGDPTTEELSDFGWASGGPYNNGRTFTWDDTSTSVTLSAGVHRFFLVDESTSYASKGDPANTRFHKVWTENNVYALAGTCQVLVERG